MAEANLIVGDDSVNVLVGTGAADLIYGFNPNGPQSQVNTISATRVVSGLSQALFAVAPPGDQDRLFIVQKTGQISILNLETNQLAPTPFLNLAGQISITGEQGLLGLAFAPDFAQSGYFYVSLINLAGDTEIRRYQVSSSNGGVADPASATTIIVVDQPNGVTNHKAGWIGFGPDGYLYVPLGDGGGGGDPFQNGQNMGSLLAKILRLDVRADAFPTDPNRNYAIPSDNPFLGVAGAAPEIWALGSRNPYRDSFDRGLGNLFIADVGQDNWEEVNIGLAGANYGWNTYEGPSSFPGAGTLGPGVLTFPTHAYDHSVGRSITGGYVYRGTSDGLQGQYFFADFIFGKVFTLRFDGSAWIATERTAQIVPNAGAVGNISSFGEDGRGDLYLVDYDGEIFRLTPQLNSADQGDTLRGNAGNDMLMGGAGADLLDGGQGNDVLNGGDGIDTADYRDASSGVIAELWRGNARNDGQGGSDILIRIENIVGSSFNDILAGDSGANFLIGGPGNDGLYGAGGNDTVDYGAAGNVRAELWQGNASNDGQGGTDILIGIENLVGSAFSDILAGDAGNNLLRGGAGNDGIYGAGGIDTADYSIATSGVRAELWQGNAASDGQGGTDILVGIENLIGSNFNDILAGDAGNNVLIGGAGSDTLVGAAGADSFAFNSGSGVDYIFDFTKAQGDKVNLQSNLNGSGITTGAQALAATGDVNGSAVINLGGNSVTLIGVTTASLAASDFVIF